VTFVKFKWSSIAEEEEEIKHKRLGSPVEFEESRIFELRDDKSISTKTDEKAGIELGSSEETSVGGQDLKAGLAENPEE
jgi:dynactin complex subunit